MRVFKNAVDGRVLNHPSASLKENCRERRVDGREGGREEGREGGEEMCRERRKKIFICEAMLAACCFSLASSFHLSGGEVGGRGRTL